MYIFQNALKNIARNKSRNGMIGAIIFAIILTTVVALVINNTASAVIEDYKDRFGSEVSISPDTQKLRDEAMQNSTDGRIAIRMPTLSSELYLQFADSEYLKESIATASAGANSESVRAIDQSDDTDDSDTSGNTTFSMGGGMVRNVMGGGGNFRLLGDSWEEFKEGTRSMESGELPQNDFECVISADLRDENNIEIGDTVSFTVSLSIDVPESIDSKSLVDGETLTVNGIDYTISVMDADMGMVRLTRDAVYELKVVGIYTDLTDEYPNENISNMAGMNKRNEVLTTLSTLLAQRSPDEGGVTLNITYYLKSPDLLADFEAEVRAKGLPDTFLVDTDSASYDSVVKPVLGLKSISLTFMLVVIALGAIILLFLASISIRERKYEIGVLRAMGMKKSKVALGLWSEMLAITCVCLIIGLGVGMIVSQPVSDALLKNQVEAAESTQQQPNGQNFMTAGRGGGMMMGGGRLPGSSQSNAQPLSEMKITLSFITVLEIIAVSILLASAAGLVSISKITKFEPIKILMERN